MNDIPYMFIDSMATAGMQLNPREVRGQHVTAVEYYKWILYNKIYSCYKFTLPKNWSLKWFRWWLFQYGSIAVAYTNEFGWICQPYSIITLDYMYQPQKIQIYNALIKERVESTVGVDSSIIVCFDNYMGFEPIVKRYAELLASVEKDLNISLMNSNVGSYFEVDNQKEANEIKEAYTQATAGTPLTVTRKNLINGEKKSLFPDVKKNFIGLDLMELRRSIINAFLTEIGIPNVSVQKKERLTQGEYQQNEDETKAIARVVYENIKESMNVANAVSGLNLSVEYVYNVSRETLEKGGVDNG